MKKLIILLAALTLVSAGCKKKEVIEPVTQVAAKDNLAKEKLAEEKLAREKTEAERLEKERLEKERLEVERLAREKAALLKAEAQRLEKEKLELARLAKEKARLEQLSKEKAAREKMLATLKGIKLEHFVLESADITPSLAENIKRIIEEINDRTGVLTVVGHTDSTGTTDYNYVLSEKRAKSVEDFLRSYGLSSSIEVVVTWKGEDSPKYTNSDNDGRSKNRRVDFIFSDSK